MLSQTKVIPKIEVEDLFYAWIEQQIFDLQFFKKIYAHNSLKLAKINCLERDLKTLPQEGLNTKKNENWEDEKDRRISIY